MGRFKKNIFIILAVLAAIVLVRHVWHRMHPMVAGHGNVLCDFENPKVWDISPEHGFSIRLSGRHVTEGRHSLEVTYPTGDYPSINTKKLRHNWGSYESLGLDVYNPQNATLDFGVRLDDLSGKRININLSLDPGLNKIEIPYSRISSRINASHIRFIVFYLKGPDQRYTLYFDNLHLIHPKMIPGLEEEFGGLSASMAGHKPPAPLPVRKAVIVSEKPPLKQGSIEAVLVKIKNVPDNNPLISAGVPFAPGQLMSVKNVAFFEKSGQEIPIAAKVLAYWPQDHSIRSVLVQFHHQIENAYSYVTMKWGQPRQTKDLDIVEPTWEFPEGFILFPAQWLCDSKIMGDQVPMGQRMFPSYDEHIDDSFPMMEKKGLIGNIDTHTYYSSAHVLYQIYARSGELKYFLAARKALIYYRENEIIHEGPNRGRDIHHLNDRYIYVDAMADDYLLTGDPRSYIIAGYMAEYLKNHFPPRRAFFPKSGKYFWTERLVAYPFLGVIAWYELTGDPDYLKLSGEYMKNLYRTQMEWPSRGGYIHNLYYHDPTEGARPDEYGGSPFMTGLLLEAVIKYHQLTDSPIAADSIFRALHWLIHEGLANSGDTFKYTTADCYADSDGTPDLNLLIAHAFGYGYKISGYKEQQYLDVGIKVFDRGIKDASLNDGKHFNQNYRSSGHFLAYIAGGLKQANNAEEEEKPISDGLPKGILYYGNFDFSSDRFHSLGDSKLDIDKNIVYLNGNSLRIKSGYDNSNLSAALKLDGWSLKAFPLMSFAYRIPKGTPVGMRVQSRFGDWICLGGTHEYQCSGNASPKPVSLIDDGQWHEITVDVHQVVTALLANLDDLSEFQFY
ncbi:MAG: hypothetical protein KGJ11_05845, partial [Candidatus Omnitrophica bacterium]|nr:hypothetical protein [Candidatus Omnitrophota bacterium]